MPPQGQHNIDYMLQLSQTLGKVAGSQEATVSLLQSMQSSHAAEMKGIRDSHELQNQRTTDALQKQNLQLEKLAIVFESSSGNWTRIEQNTKATAESNTKIADELHTTNNTVKTHSEWIEKADPIIKMFYKWPEYRDWAIRIFIGVMIAMIAGLAFILLGIKK